MVHSVSSLAEEERIEKVTLSYQNLQGLVTPSPHSWCRILWLTP